MNNFDNSGRRMVGDASGVQSFFTKVYGMMGLSVLVSALSAFLFAVYFPAAATGGSGLIILIVWFIVAIGLQMVANSNPTLGFIGLMIFAVLTGITFSDIFAIFNLGQIWGALLSASAVFIVLSSIGLMTKRDISGWSTQAFAALIALLIVMIINLFLKSTLFEMFIDAAGIIIFTILSATDTQNLKNVYEQYAGEVNVNGLAINGALTLYLDFINLFQFILEIIGLSSNDR